VDWVRRHPGCFTHCRSEANRRREGAHEGGCEDPLPRCKCRRLADEALPGHHCSPTVVGVDTVMVAGGMGRCPRAIDRIAERLLSGGRRRMWRRTPPRGRTAASSGRPDRRLECDQRRYRGDHTAYGGRRYWPPSAQLSDRWSSSLGWHRRTRVCASRMNGGFADFEVVAGRARLPVGSKTGPPK